MPFNVSIINQLEPVIKNDRKKRAMNLMELIFLNFEIMKNTATVKLTNTKAAGPFVSKARPKKKPAKTLVLKPNLPMGLLV